jgi:hypothetical protein
MEDFGGTCQQLTCLLILRPNCGRHPLLEAVFGPALRKSGERSAYRTDFTGEVIFRACFRPGFSTQLAFMYIFWISMMISTERRSPIFDLAK